MTTKGEFVVDGKVVQGYRVDPDDPYVAVVPDADGMEIALLRPEEFTALKERRE